MKSSKKKLKKAIKRTAKFMLKLEVDVSARVPEWYDQFALSAQHNGLNNNLYEAIFKKLRACLKKEYGESATKFLLR